MGHLPDRLALFQTGRRSIVTTPGLRINPKVIDTAGSDINIILNAAALMGENLSAEWVTCLQGLYVTTAEGSALDRIAADRFQITRLPASPATVTLTFTRPTFAFGAVTINAGTRAQTAAGTQFATDVDIVFSGTDLVKTGTATALIAGPDSNTIANSITQIVDPVGDSTIVVSNPDSGTPGLSTYVPGGAAGGADTESDISFRGRVLEVFSTLHRGTLGAIEFGARTVPGVAVAKAIEINNDVSGNPVPAAAIQLIVADASGAFSAPMLTAVRDAILKYRAAGIPVTVSGGVVSNQSVQWRLAYETGIDQVRAQDEVRAVTSAVAQFLKPGETLYTSSLIAAARTVPGVIVSNTSLVLPVGDTVPGSNTTLIRIPLTSVSFV